MRAREAARPALLLALLAVLSGTASAKPELKAFGLQYLGGYVELGLRGYNNRGGRAGTPDFVNDSLKVDEILHLDMDGFVYHPNLLEIDAALNLHFLQEVMDGEFFFLPGGHIRLDFLEKKPYGLSLFAEAGEKDIERRFAPSYELFTQSYGAALRLGMGPLPFQASYTHREQQRTLDPLNEFDETWDDFRFRGRYDLTESSRGEINYLFTDGIAREQRIIRHDVLVDNTTYFGGDAWKRLMSRARYFQLGGRSDLSIASFMTNYDWRHTERLRSNYQFNYQHEKLESSQVTDSFGMDGMLSHRLYANLDSTLVLFGNYEDASFGTNLRYGARVQENYVKRLSDWGRLHLGVSPYVEMNETNPSQPSAFVKGEAQRFLDLQPVVLRSRDILKPTIRVYADERLDPIDCPYPRDGLDCVYREGVGGDYEVRNPDSPPEDTTLLDRNPLGNIAVGQPLLVDYERLLSDQDRLLYGVRGNFHLWYGDWLNLFADVGLNQEEILRGSSEREPSNPRHQRVGIRTEGHWVAAEIGFENNMSTTRDSMGTYQLLNLRSPWQTWWRGSVSAYHGMRTFSEPEQDSRIWRASATLDVRLGRRGQFNLQVDYENQDWEGAQNANARDIQRIGMRPSLQWRYRRLELIMEAQLYVVDQPAVDLTQTFDRFFVRLRRYF
jgi:hypothetical protein